LTYEESFTISVTNVNDAPTNLRLNAVDVSVPVVAENSAIGTTFGTLEAFDQDAGATLTYALTAGDGDADNASFAIDGTTLKTKARFDFETKDTYTIRVKVTDNAGATYEKSFTIMVTDVNEAPTVTATPLTLKTGQTSKVTIKGTDEDKDTLVYSILVAPAQGNATINAQSGELSYTAPSKPVSERIVIRVSDGKSNTDKELVVTVSQANRAPVVASANLTMKNNDIMKGKITGSDADGNRLAYRAKTNPKNGKLFIKSDGVFSYIPNAKFVGTDRFSVVANDGIVDSAPKTYTITVKSGVVTLPTHFKYMGGYPDGKFKPEQGVTRAEIVASLVRLTNVKGKVPTKSSFKDVKPKNWYFESLEIAYQNKLMSGRSVEKFEPDSTLTRKEMQQLVSRLIERGLVNVDENSLKSVNIPWLVKDGKLLNVRSNSLVKRSEAVVIFNRLFKRGPLNGYNNQVWSDVLTSHPNFKDIQEASVTHEGELREDGLEYFVRLK
jgi:hypothetical protein